MAECKLCGGFGFIQKDDGYMGLPTAVPCRCRIEKALDAQADKAWAQLSKIPKGKKSLLKGKLDSNLLVTGDKSQLSLNLRRALWIWEKPEKFVKVVSDATLMSAWLSSASLKMDIADPDFRRDIRVATLEDLAEAPDLLIIRLGVKMARNSAMPEVLVEAIELRQHLNKATWVVIDPEKPLEEGHVAWSRAVEESLEGWDEMNLLAKTATASKRSRKSSSPPITADTLSPSPRKRFNL